MRIGELARRVDLSASRIRFYEAQRLLPKAGRSDNGYRDYPDSVVETLRFIQAAQSLGFAVSEIRNGLELAAPDLPSKHDVLPALQFKLTSLDEHIAEASRRRQRIIDLIDEITNARQPSRKTVSGAAKAPDRTARDGRPVAAPDGSSGTAGLPRRSPRR